MAAEDLITPVAPAQREPEPGESTPTPTPKGRAAVATLARLTNKTRNPWVGAVFGVVVLVLLGVIGFLVYDRFYADPTRNAQAGHCLADVPVPSPQQDQEVKPARLVYCGDADAVFVIDGRLDGLTEAQAQNETVCEPFEDSTFAYRVVPPGGTGYVLCLHPIAK